MMPYNTRRKPILLKAYGREVQTMVEHALTIADRSERQAYAYRIVEAMQIVTDQLRATNEVMVKLWNHLAQMAGYQLDIDYPVEIEPHTAQQRPQRLAYPQKQIRLRHYGHLFETFVQQLEQENDPQQRALLIRLAAARMRRNLAEVRGDVADARRVAHDIEFYTHGAVASEEVVAALGR